MRGTGIILFMRRSRAEEDEIYAPAKFIDDYNIKKGSIDERYLPYVKEVAAAIYDACYRKVESSKK